MMDPVPAYGKRLDHEACVEKCKNAEENFKIGLLWFLRGNET